jgi:hypothetical protein
MVLPKETPPSDRHGGSVEYIPEAVDMTAFTVLLIFTMADWSTNATLLILGLCLRWLRRRTA